MIVRVLQASGTASEKKERLQQIISQASTKPKELEHQICSEKHSKDLAAKLTSISFGLTVELVLNAFSIEACFSYLNHESENSEGLTEFLKTTLAQKSPSKFQELARIPERLLTLEKALVVLSGFAEFCPRDIEEHELPKFMPTFIRLSSFIITKYLQLKNEPAKDKSDRIECDRVILDNCEKWVAESMAVFFEDLHRPHDPLIRHMSLLCLGDIIGALLESMRENNLEKSILQNLLENTLMKYLYSVYPYEQIYGIYIKQLQSAKFANPVQKILIPQVYDSKQQLNTQAFGYMTLSYLSTPIYSLKKQLQYLAVAASESLIRPYEVKLPLVQKLLMVMKKLAIITISDGTELNYPVALLLFNFHCHCNEYYEQISKHIRFISPAVETNSFLNLKFVNGTTLTPQINSFLLKWLNEQHIEDINAVLILKEIGKDGPIHKKNYGLLKSICCRLPQKYLSSLIEQWQEAGVADQQTLTSLHSE